MSQLIDKDYVSAREEFIAQWGATGSAWGINRTMAQIHALLMTAPQPLSTDEVMAELQISRGNANGNLRDLIGWGLVRKVVRKGERKEYFESEKDIWKMFCTIVRERKRREIEPIMATLSECHAATSDCKSEAARQFNKQMKELDEFVRQADKVMDAVARSSRNKLMPMALKLLK